MTNFYGLAGNNPPCPKRSGVSLIKNTPEIRGLIVVRLELEPRRQLNLALAEESAIRAGGVAKRRIGNQALSKPSRAARGGEVVEGAVHVGNLSPVEEVKPFCQQLEFRSFGNAKPSRYAHVDVPDVWLLESVAQILEATGAA